MRWRRIAFWLAFSTLALVVLALSWLWTADLGVFKPQLERFVTEQTGREFAIDGEFHIDLSRQTTVIAEDIRFANAEWADAGDMVTVGRAEIRIDLWSLVSGPALVEFVDLDDTAILLLNPGDTAPNWELPVESAPAGEDEAGPGILFGIVDIDRLHLRLESAERDRPLNLEIESLDQVYRDDGNLDLDLDGTLDGRVVRVEGEFGTWEALLAGKNPQFDVAVVLDTFELSARGRIDDLASPVRPQFEFTATGPDIDDLTRLLGLGEEGEGDINLSGELAPLDSERLRLRVEGNLGQTEIDALGEFADLQRFGNMQLKATASGPDLGRVLRLAGIHKVREAPFMVRIDAETDGGALLVNEASMVFADTQLDGSARLPNFPNIDDAVISLEVEGPDIERFRYITGVPGAASGPFSISGTLDVREDGVEILDVKARTELGELEADGTLGDPHNFYGSRMRFQLKSDNLARTAGAYGIEGLPAVAVQVSGRAEYTRDGIRTIEPLTANMTGNSASVEGLVPLAAGGVGADLQVAADGPDLAALAGLFTDAEGIPVQPYSLAGGLRIEKQGYRLSNVTATLGNTALSGAGLLVMAENLAGSRFEVRVSGPALEELVPTLDEVGVQDGPFELQAGAAFTSDRVELQGVSFERPNARLDFDASVGLPLSRRWVDFDVRASGSDVRNVLRHVQGLEAYEQPFSLDAKGRLRGNHWDFDHVAGAVGNANVDARGDLALDGSASRTELTFDLAIPNLAEIGTLNGRTFNEQAVARDFASGLVEANADLAMTTDLDIDLSSTGADLRTLAANTNGVVYVDTRGGRLKFGEMITAIYGNMLEEMLNTINPLRKNDPYTDFECLIMPLTIDDGKVSGAPSIFVSTAKIRAVTQGSLNLRTEEIRIGVRTTPRKVVSISAAELFNPYLEVVGTLASPRLAVDETGVLLTGGAAVATGGLSLLARGIWDRLSKSGDACNQMSAEALKRLEGRLPDLVIENSSRLE